MRPFEYRKRAGRWAALTATMAIVVLFAAIATPAAEAEMSEPPVVPAPAAVSASAEEAIAVAADETLPPTEAASAAPAADEVPLPRSAPAPEASGGPEPIAAADSTDAVSPPTDSESSVSSLPTGSESSGSLADEAAPTKILPSGLAGSETVSAAVEGLSEPIRRTSATTAPAVAGVMEVLDFVSSSATAILPAMPTSPLGTLPAMPTSPLGLDPNAFGGTSNFTPALTPASTAPKAAGRLGADSAPIPLAAASPQPRLGPFLAGLPFLAATRQALAPAAAVIPTVPTATDLHSGSSAGVDRSPPSPSDPLPPPFEAPDAVSGSGGSFFVPLAALLALLALAAPATFRRRREAPGFLAPVPFVCALERPG